MLTADIPGLKIERTDNENGDSLITLVQDDGCGQIDRIALHPIHVRYLAEHMGLLEMADQQSRKTITAMKRRLEVLAHRIEFLRHCLIDLTPDNEQADVSVEQEYIKATSAITDEFMLESGINPISVIVDDEPIASVTAKQSPKVRTPAAQQPLI